MSEHFFGLGPGHLPASADRIAQKHGACLVNFTEPGGDLRHWFAGPNRGEPFDSRMATAVMSDVEAHLAARALGRKGGSQSSPAKTAAVRANARKRWEPRIAAAIERIRDVGREHGDLSLVADARLWRYRQWRAELRRRVALHDPAIAEAL